MCIINGRVQGKDDYTYATTRGKYMLDYCLTLMDHLKYIKSCNVIRVKEILEELSFTKTCSVPDHSILSVNVELLDFILHKESSSNNFKDMKLPFNQKYRVWDIPNTFMNDSFINNDVLAL